MNSSDQIQADNDAERVRDAAPDLLAALHAARGYLMNAAIDLEIGAPKKTAIATLRGGIEVIGTAIQKATGQKA